MKHPLLWVGMGAVWLWRQRAKKTPPATVATVATSITAAQTQLPALSPKVQARVLSSVLRRRVFATVVGAAPFHLDKNPPELWELAVLYSLDPSFTLPTDQGERPIASFTRFFRILEVDPKLRAVVQAPPLQRIANGLTLLRPREQALYLRELAESFQAFADANLFGQAYEQFLLKLPLLEVVESGTAGIPPLLGQMRRDLETRGKGWAHDVYSYLFSTSEALGLLSGVTPDPGHGLSNAELAQRMVRNAYEGRARIAKEATRQHYTKEKPKPLYLRRPSDKPPTIEFDVERGIIDRAQEIERAEKEELDAAISLLAKRMK